LSFCYRLNAVVNAMAIWNIAKLRIQFLSTIVTGMETYPNSNNIGSSECLRFTCVDDCCTNSLIPMRW
jgi:hypothetical protein